MGTVRESSKLRAFFEEVDPHIVRFMATYGLPFLRVTLGVIFLWFGLVKLVPGLSPEEELIRHTVYFLDPDVVLAGLALLESLIGLGLILGKWLRFVLLLLFLQMAGTALPLILLPQVVWKAFPYALTLEGQYIVKNLVLMGAGLVLGGTVKGGRLDPEPAARLP